MGQIQPLRAIYYNPHRPNVGSLLAPPYDVLSADDKRQLLQRDANNFVCVDLPHVPPKSAGPPEAYAQAKQTLDHWLASKVVVRADRPALYVYHQKYTHAGRAYTRKMFFARLRLEPFGAGQVYPHEQTFGGPKEDRLLLTQATACNLSPIFGLYSDARRELSARLDAHTGSPSLLHGELGGVANELWAIQDAHEIRAVQDLMHARPVYIADGHHRYGTSLLYQTWLRERQGELPSDHPANFVLCVFCAMEDDGLLILPTHRVLPGLTIDVDSWRAEKEIEVTPLEGAAAAAVQKLPAMGPQSLALRTHDGRMFALRPKRPELLDALEPAHSPAWRRLALAFLHAYLLERLITPKLPGGRAPEIHYIKSIDDAVAEANATRGSVFFLQPNTMDELRAVCNAGDLMPQKSTFFYPKLASGLVVHPLFD